MGRIASLALMGLAALAVMLIPAATAGATTFCVPGFFAACPDNGTNVDKSDLESALNSDGSDDESDQVLIAPGTITDTGTIEISAGTDDLLIRGSGPDQTILTSSVTTNSYVINLASNDRLVSMHDLTIQIPASMPDGVGSGIQVEGDELENVDIVSLNPGSSAAPSWPGGGTYLGGVIRSGSGGSITEGIHHGHNGTVTVDDVTIEGALIATSNTDPDGELIIRNSHITDASVGVEAQRGTTTVTDTQISSLAPGSLGLSAPYAAAADDAFVNADHVTILGASLSAVGVSSQVASGAVGGAKVTIRNSIVAAPTSYLCGSEGTGTAEVLAYYSNISEVSGNADPGCSTLMVDTLSGDPGFRSATDLRLTAGSPSIDSGDPTGIFPGLDLFGLPRATDGNGDDVVRTDQGAYELDGIAPTTKLDSGPGGGKKKGRAKFSFSSNELGARFKCKLDRKKVSACVSPKSYKRLKPGRHTFKVFAVDSYGNKDASPAVKSFRVPG